MKLDGRVVLIFLIIIILSGGIAIIVLSNPGENSDVENGSLCGNVTVGPLTPVETPGWKPSPEPIVFTSRGLVVYEADGRTKVADIGIEAAGYNGKYCITLKPGSYVLDLRKNGIERADVLPKAVTIYAGKPTIVDVDIDTGIR